VAVNGAPQAVTLPGPGPEVERTDLTPPVATGTPEAAPGPSEHPVALDIRDLKTYFFTYDGIVRALDGVTFQVRRGETTGIVGETGCGKSVTAFSITRLIADPPGRVVSGTVHLGDMNLLWGLEQEAKIRRNPRTDRVRIRRSFRRIKQMNERMASIRGGRIGMIFQEPSQAMNPIFSIADQVGESLLLHRGTEIVDAMLSATLDSPALADAVAGLDSLLASGQTADQRSAADAIGRAGQLESLGTEVFHLLHGGGVLPQDAPKEVDRVIRRRHLSKGQRRYLEHRRRLMVLRQHVNEVSVQEMRTGQRMARARLRISRALLLEQLRHFYYGVWGIRGFVQRPLKNETFWRVVKRLEGVSIANPAQVARGYPFELSGGMIQRVMIAMALAPEPDVLIADEPTTALDVTIQAQILALMRDLKERVGTAIVLITHDLAVIAEVADRVNVMYAGRIVESAPVRELFRHPLHPYTQGLLASIPRLDRPEKELQSIPGSVPDLIRPPSGCRFHPRCPYAMPICKGETPPMTVEGPGHQTACYLYKGPVATQ
jgi:peptide/nickel transport system ATP-binding protein